MRRLIPCPACSCDVSHLVANAVALKRVKRLNKQRLLRVAKLLERAEDTLRDSNVASAGNLWRQDVIAIRYVFNALMADIEMPLPTPPIPASEKP